MIGESVWNFIHGRPTRHLYEMLFKKVRTNKKQVNVPLRCDSPQCRRFMSLAITSLEAGTLELQGTLLREEVRSRVSLLDTNMERTHNFVTICSWCKRVLLPDEKWREVEEAVLHLALFNARARLQLTHGICPRCLSDISRL